jgi:hypothetical protein
VGQETDRLRFSSSVLDIWSDASPKTQHGSTGKGSATHLERPPVIGLQSLLGSLQRIIVIEIDSRIVNKHIHPALVLLDLVNQSLNLGLVRDIQLRVFGLALQTEIFTRSRTGVEDDGFGSGGGEDPIADGCSDSSVLIST